MLNYLLMNYREIYEIIKGYNSIVLNITIYTKGTGIYHMKGLNIQVNVNL